jgi:hypothetical protein
MVWTEKENTWECRLSFAKDGISPPQLWQKHPRDNSTGDPSVAPSPYHLPIPFFSLSIIAISDFQ